VWNIHLWYKLYGPYAACNKGVTSEKQLITCDYAGVDSTFVPRADSNRDKIGRMGEINALLFHEPFRQALFDQRDVILVGDFNSPSHLDWTPATKFSHCGWSCEWPISKKLAEYGFMDSFRMLKPDANADRGITWTPIYRFNSDFPGVDIEEPQDRIDRIYYRGPHLIPFDSKVYNGKEPIELYPNHLYNDWPSDHSAVITDFIIQT